MSNSKSVFPLGRVAWAFRGYNVTNQGRSHELLAHRVYGPTVRAVLGQASEICAEALGRPVDLVSRVLDHAATTLDSFADDVATVVAMEWAQVKLLEEHFGVAVDSAAALYGYSIGEITALVVGGVFPLENLLPVPLRMAPDAAQLGADVQMGVVFSREKSLPEESIQRLCLEISSENKGMIGPSAVLSPNTLLVLGQGDTVDRLRQRVKADVPAGNLRRNPNRWPPLHTPLVDLKNISSRASVSLHSLIGGIKASQVPIFSLVTGQDSYKPNNVREHLIRWCHQPQRLWDVILLTLSRGIDTVAHFGPEPNVIPATYDRLAQNVSAQFGGRVARMMGRRIMSGLSRPWLASRMPAQSALLRAPFVQQLVVEDWLLNQEF